MGFISFHAYFAFAFVLLCVCNGMPPKQKPTTSNRSYFTDQERELLLNMLNNFAQKGPYSPRIWKEIAKAFEERRDKVYGFSTHRTGKSLRLHFHYIVKADKIKLPGPVRQLYEQMKRTVITPQEQDFIHEQLLGSEDDGLALLGDKRWKNIQMRHEAKRKAGEPGFPNKRTFGGIRTHFQAVMMPKNLVMEAVKQKYPEYFKGKKRATSNGGTNQADNGLKCYTKQEHELMVKMLEPLGKTGGYTHTVWKDIEKAFEEKREANAEGFVLPRTLCSIRQHFVRSGCNQKSDALRKVYEQMKRMCITCEEQQLINSELARTDLPPWTSLNDIWKTIEEKHDAYREAGIPGFAHQRSWATLRNHFYSIMKPKNLVDKAVMEKFLFDFVNNQCALSAEERQQLDIGSGESMELSSNEDENYDAWIDEYGVDDFMVLEPIEAY